MATIVLSPDQPISQKAALGAAAAKGFQDISQLLFELQLRRDKLQQESEENRLRQLGISIPFMQMAQAAKRQQETDAIHAKEREEDQAREDERFRQTFANQREMAQFQADLTKGINEAREASEEKHRAPKGEGEGSEMERLMNDLAKGNPKKLRQLKRAWFSKKIKTGGATNLYDFLGQLGIGLAPGGGGVGGVGGGSGLSPQGADYRKRLLDRKRLLGGQGGQP